MLVMSQSFSFEFCIANWETVLYRSRMFCFIDDPIMDRQMIQICFGFNSRAIICFNLLVNGTNSTYLQCFCGGSRNRS